MGNCCGKGSKTFDPDKTPYQPANEATSKGKKGKKKSAKNDVKNNTPRAIEEVEKSREPVERNSAEKEGKSSEAKNYEEAVKTAASPSPEDQVVVESNQKTSAENSPLVTEAVIEKDARVSHHKTKIPDDDHFISTANEKDKQMPEPSPAPPPAVHTAAIHVIIPEEKQTPRPSSLPRLASPKSPRSPVKPEEPEIDPKTIIENVKSKVKDGKYSELVTSIHSSSATKPSSPKSLIQTSPITEPTPSSTQHIAARSPLAILENLQYLKQTTPPEGTGGDKQDVEKPKSAGRGNGDQENIVITKQTPPQAEVQPVVELRNGTPSPLKDDVIRHIDSVVDEEFNITIAVNNNKIREEAIEETRDLENGAVELKQTNGGHAPTAVTEISDDDEAGEGDENILYIEESPKYEKSNQEYTPRYLSPNREAKTSVASIGPKLSVPSSTEDYRHRQASGYSTVSSPSLSSEDKLSETDFSCGKTYNEIFPSEASINASIAIRYEYIPGTRTRLLQSIDHYMEADDANSNHRATIIFLTGPPGIGKSSVMKELSSKYALQLAGSYFFCYNCTKQEHNSFRYALLAMINTFVSRVDGFRDNLPPTEQVADMVDKSSTAEIADKLLFRPLLEDEDRVSSQKLILIIDAIDECDDAEELANFVVDFKKHAPPWLVLCLSARSDNKLVSSIGADVMLEMKTTTADNQHDMTKILKPSVEPCIDKISSGQAIHSLAKKSQGFTLCTVLYKRIISQLNRQIQLRDLDLLFPAGFDSVLESILQAFSKNATDKKCPDAYSIVLSLIALAREPLPKSFIDNIGLKSKPSLDILDPILEESGEKLYLIHPAVSDWLLSSSGNSASSVNFHSASAIMAKYCLQWIEPATADNSRAVPRELTAYAVKHCIYHLIDAANHVEDVGKLLCCLKFIQYTLAERLLNKAYVLSMYDHQHVQMTPQRRVVNVDSYLEKHPHIYEQVKAYRNFVNDNLNFLAEFPFNIWQAAANYTECTRLQENAKFDLGKSPWLEDVKAQPETMRFSKSLPGRKVAADVSGDGKYLAVVTTDGSTSTLLRIISLPSLAEKVINVADGVEQTSACCRFSGDSSFLFVGSLTHFVTLKGAVVHSGLSLDKLPIQQYTVESSDLTWTHLVVSLNTFPHGGRSVYLAIFNIRDKSLVANKEILTFRFGGSANLGIKACSIQADKKLVAACVKQTNKPQIKVDIWNFEDWTMLHECTLDCESVSSCNFVKSEKLVLDSVGSSNRKKVHVWQFNDPSCTPYAVDEEDFQSLSVSCKSQAMVCSWKFEHCEVVIKDLADAGSNLLSVYRINGVQSTCIAVASKAHVCFISDNDLHIFAYSDLIKKSSLCDSVLRDQPVNDVIFLPRSNSALLAHVGAMPSPGRVALSVYLLEFTTDLSVKSTPLVNYDASSFLLTASNKIFPDESGKILRTSSDGNFAVVCDGESVLIVDLPSNSIKTITIEQGSGLQLCVVAPKDPALALLYKNDTTLLVFHDLATGLKLRDLRLDVDTSATSTDLCLIPATSNVITFSRDDDSGLFEIWNSKTGDNIQQEHVKKLYFCKVSPSSDRLALSCKYDEARELYLLSSDRKFSVKLDTCGSWSGKSEESDVCFSPDGTVLVGVSMAHSLCRVWNAGNGEVLRDMATSYKENPFVAGMLTNTHVAVFDGRLLIFEVASGLLTCAVKSECAVGRRKLLVSPRGQLVIGVFTDQRLMVFKTHNFDSIKRKTTLQRMKSIS